jgi:hypothetical protein
MKNCTCDYGCPCDFNARPTKGYCKGLFGMHSAEGTLFHIASLIVAKMHEPLFAPFEWRFDMAGRRARLNVPGVLETDVEPIKNPVTGADHRIQVHMPEGFEHRHGEIASARIASMGAIKLRVDKGHSTLATVVQTPAGVAG